MVFVWRNIVLGWGGFVNIFVQFPRVNPPVLATVVYNKLIFVIRRNSTSNI